MQKKRLFQTFLLVLLICGTIFVIRRQHNMPYQRNEGLVFGTTYRITYQADENYEEEIKATLAEVDSALSMFNKESVISKVNRGESVELNDRFLEVYNLAMQISEETDGAFDITVAPLVNAWGFGFKTQQKPGREQVDSLLRLVGFKKISLEERPKSAKGGRTQGPSLQVVKKNLNTMLDCSAIAKGYGVDAVATMLQEKGVRNLMVEIGGEVVTRGISDKRLPWRVGVIKPTDDSLAVNGEIQQVLNVSDVAMATSGNYRNFYVEGGRKYAHTIDPRTGYPVQHNILSATVLAPTCAVADAYATSFMVLGLDGAQAILEKHPELMAYLIYNNEKGENAVWFSPSLKGKYIE